MAKKYEKPEAYRSVILWILINGNKPFLFILVMVLAMLGLLEALQNEIENIF